MAEEPSFLSVCQLASNVYDLGPISASSHLASVSSIIFLHGTSWIDIEDNKLPRSCLFIRATACHGITRVCLVIPLYFIPDQCVVDKNDLASTNSDLCYALDSQISLPSSHHKP